MVFAPDLISSLSYGENEEKWFSSMIPLYAYEYNSSFGFRKSHLFFTVGDIVIYNYKTWHFLSLTMKELISIN
jgi:L-amino acid N-acyltransferase YncA